ncbi:MAG TPA: efflux RND transporter periplasmic adaptor subunit [Pyrinomonadaceae bacterium]|nr:efflux RND transporter periplasmic adaptor subunit [Pyrinomonadaceae bacterium]
MKRLFNVFVWLIVVGIAGALLVLWLRPQPARVDTANAVRGPLQITVDGEGRTRVRDRYVVASPVPGRLRRITLRRGDSVHQDQLIAQIESLPLAPLDPRQRAEASARVNAAEDAQRERDAMVERAKAGYEQARRESERCEKLVAAGVISRQELERAQTAMDVAARELNAARSRSETTGHDVEVARSALLSLGKNQKQSVTTVQVHAPVSGRVLRVIEESERVISAGTALVELSNPSKLEVVIELLSTDAVKVKPGALVLIERWGGDSVLQARVRLIEPSAFTKVSALGVEEQRVNVIADLTEPAQTLGDGYRVEGRIVVWENENVLKIPSSALFRTGDGWSVFVVVQNKAYLRQVQVGQRTPFEAEVISGLEDAARVIVHPSNEISEAMRVELQGN